MSRPDYKWYRHLDETDQQLEGRAVSLLSFEERDLDPETIEHIHEMAESVMRSDRDLFVSIKLYTRPRDSDAEDDTRGEEFKFRYHICAYYGEEKFLNEAIAALKRNFENDDFGDYFHDFEEENDCLFKIEILCKSLPLRLEEMAYYTLFTRKKCSADMRLLPQHKSQELYLKYGYLWFAISV